MNNSNYFSFLRSRRPLELHTHRKVPQGSEKGGAPDHRISDNFSESILAKNAKHTGEGPESGQSQMKQDWPEEAQKDCPQLNDLKHMLFSSSLALSPSPPCLPTTRPCV